MCSSSPARSELRKSSSTFQVTLVKIFRSQGAQGRPTKSARAVEEISSALLVDGCPLLQDLFRPRNQRRVEIENFFYVLLELGTIERIDVELGFGRVSKKFRILHGVHERLAQNLHAILRRAGR